jgi:hypothetical protein
MNIVSAFSLHLRYFRFLHFFFIYFCRLSNPVSHVPYFRNKICSHISNAEHLSLDEDMGGAGGGRIFQQKVVVQSRQGCEEVPQQS